MGDSLVRSRLRFRNILNNKWEDLADHEVFVRDPDNLDWIRLVPGDFSIRNQTNSGWIDIDNEAEPDIDDPCLRMTIPGSCNGGIEDKEMGSGNGIGSGGAEWEQVAGYPAGYDMPDAGLAGFGVEPVDMWPTGFALRRTGADMVESYDNAPVAAYNGDASYSNPAPAWTSVFGRGAAITEFCYMLGQTPGYVDLTWVCWEQFGMSVDVYYLGIRRGTSCGKKTGRGRLRFYYDPAEGNGEERIMVRVRCNEAGRWALHCRAPSELLASEVNNLRPDYYKPYAITSMPDVLSPHYLGTPIFPAPCHAAVYVRPERLSIRGHFEYYHHVGELAGWMYLDFKSWNNKDFVEVYHYGRRIATTLDPESGRGFLKFYFDPTQNQCQDIVVRVVSEDFAEVQPDGSKPDATSVYYGLWCPETRGAREFRHPCGSYEVTSAGHPTTEDNFDLQNKFKDDVCGILINCSAGNQKAKFEVFDVNDNLLDTQIVEAGQTGNLEYWAPIGNTDVRYPRVHVTSGIGCSWRYFVHCPIQKPDVEVPSTIIPFTCVETPKADDLPGGNGAWRLVVDNVWADWINYPWREDCEYYIVGTNHDDIMVRNIIPYAPIAMTIWTTEEMFYDGGDNAPRVRMGRGDRGNPATGFIAWMGIRQVYERDIIITPDTEGTEFDNSWRIVANGGGGILGPVAWEHGYEYFVFSSDDHGAQEISQTHFFMPAPDKFPKWPTDDWRWCITTSNSNDFSFAKDKTLRASRAWDTNFKTMMVIRRPIFESQGDLDYLGWREDLYDPWAVGHAGRAFPWVTGREYALWNIAKDYRTDQHTICAHNHIVGLGKNGIASFGYGNTKLKYPVGNGIECWYDDWSCFYLMSRPFVVEGLDV